MTLPSELLPVGLLGSSTAAGGYQVSRSLRFNSADSAYLNRTPASAGNRRTWTWAGWVKRSGLGRYALFSAGSTLNSSFGIEFDSSDRLWIYNYTSGYDLQIVTTSVYRDPSSWYHLSVVVDTTQATSSNRVRVYINGTEVTAFTTASYPTSNFDTYVNTATIHTLGCYQNQTVFANAYLADVHFVDGQALDPSSFTETNATTGQLIPKAYTGSYGTNGFKLNFSDNSTTAALGTDTSSNGNTWTVNNLSVTAGSGNDSLVDTPTSYGTDTGVGGEVRGNYATWNPLAILGSQSTINNGNLTFPGGANSGNTSTIGMTSGKWYWEIVYAATGGNQLYLGITNVGGSYDRVAGLCGIRDTGVLYNGNGATTNGSGTTALAGGDIVNFAYDADNKRLFIGQNNTWLNSANPAAGTNATYTNVQGSVLYAGISENASSTTHANFGQRAFAYTAPSGFKALCDTNLPTPVIAKPNTVMDVKLYTGNGTSQSITGLGFSPDLVWIKVRDNVRSHFWFDTVRGATKYILSDTTGSEVTDNTTLTAFSSDGFDVSSSPDVNRSTSPIVGWCWDAGTSTVTNTAGSITSQVRANASAGFSVVTAGAGGYFGGSVGHGLGVAPEFIILKDRNGTSGWRIYHKSLGNNFSLQFTTSAANDYGSNLWAVSSTVFGTNQALSNTAVAYCFAPVSGYSSFGSYVANASSDGPFVYTGFKPRFVLCKLSSAAGADWLIFDTARSTYNVAQANLRPNTSAAEESAFPRIDVLSNGFKIRAGSGVEPNATNGNTYIYAAFAESPFQYARAR